MRIRRILDCDRSWHYSHRAGNKAALASLVSGRETPLPAELDAIVRFKGDLTLSALLAQLGARETWLVIQELAFRRGGGVVLTSPRPPVADLDSLPPAHRDTPWQAAGEVADGVRAGEPRLAVWLRLLQHPTALGEHPRRAPDAVVDEMAALVTDRGVRIFIYHDNGFAARTAAQRAWLDTFLAALEAANLVGRSPPHIGWRIWCRVADLDPEILEAESGSV